MSSMLVRGLTRGPSDRAVGRMPRGAVARGAFHHTERQPNVDFCDNPTAGRYEHLTDGGSRAGRPARGLAHDELGLEDHVLVLEVRTERGLLHEQVDRGVADERRRL